MDEKAINEIIEASASPPSAHDPIVADPVRADELDSSFAYSVATEPISVPDVTVEYGDTHTDELGKHTPVNVRCGETVHGFSVRPSWDDETRNRCVEVGTAAARAFEIARLRAKAGS